MLTGLLYIVATVIAVVFVYIKFLERRGIFLPMRVVEFTPRDVGLTFAEVYINTADHVQIYGWFIPCEKARLTVLFFHGNGGNMSHTLSKLKLLHQMSSSVFTIDYRGYGRSQGRPSERGLYRDAETAYRYLVETRGTPKENIILYGESLGGAVAIQLASALEARALIVEGTFTRGKDMARVFYPFIPSCLFSNKFDSLTRMRKVGVPKLFIHSKNDEIVPFILGRRLYEASGEPRRFIEIRGAHNTAFLDSQEKYVSSLVSFMAGLGGR